MAGQGLGGRLVQHPVGERDEVGLERAEALPALDAAGEGADLHLGMAQEQAQHLSPGVPAGSGDGDTCRGHVHDYTEDCMSVRVGGRLSGVTARPWSVAGRRFDRGEQLVDGDAYEHFMGRWSRSAWRRGSSAGCSHRRTALGRRGLRDRCPHRDGAASSPRRPRCWRSTRVPGFVEAARRGIDDPRVEFGVRHGRRLPAMPGTSSSPGLVLNFVPDPAAAVAAMTAAAPGRHGRGVRLGLRGRMQLLRTFWDVGVLPSTPPRSTSTRASGSRSATRVR